MSESCAFLLAAWSWEWIPSSSTKENPSVRARIVRPYERVLLIPAG